MNHINHAIRQSSCRPASARSDVVSEITYHDMHMDIHNPRTEPSECARYVSPAAAAIDAIHCHRHRRRPSLCRTHARARKKAIKIEYYSANAATADRRGVRVHRLMLTVKYARINVCTRASACLMVIVSDGRPIERPPSPMLPCVFGGNRNLNNSESIRNTRVLRRALSNTVCFRSK